MRWGNGGVTGWPRRGGQRVIPDLTETGVVPADHMKSGLRRAGGGKRGETKSGNGAKNGKSTHVEMSPERNVRPVGANILRGSGAGEGVAPNIE